MEDTSEKSDCLHDTTQNAETLEFEIRKDIPGVKSTISDKCDWTPVSIKQPSLTDEFDTNYLKNCKGCWSCENWKFDKGSYPDQVSHLLHTYCY